MPMGIGPGLSVTRGGSVTGIGAIGADLALWFDENQAYKSSGGGIVTPDSILTYTAPSPKLVYGSDGVLRYAPHNLIRYSQELNDALWPKTATGTGSIPVVTANDAIAPDGTQTADRVVFDRGAGNTAGDQSQISQSFPTTISVGLIYTASFYVKAADPSSVGKIMAYRTVAAAAYSNVVITDTWQRVSISRTAAAVVLLLELNSRGTSGADNAFSVHLWGAQVSIGSTLFDYVPTTTAAVYSLPRDHNPTTGAALGVLVEEARTNLLTYSEQFQDAAWTKINSSVTANQSVAPDGTTSADLVTVTATAQTYVYIAGGVTAAGTYTFSIYAKAGTTTNFGLYFAGGFTGAYVLSGSGTATGTGASIQFVGGGWYRCVLTATVAINAAYGVFRSLTAANTFFIWGAQLEAGAFATSYIPTTNNPLGVTRAADQISILTSAFPYSATAGTMVVQASGIRGTDSRYVTIINGSNARTIDILSPAGITVRTYSDAAGFLDPLPNSIAALSENKVAAVYKLNDYAVALNGGSVSVDTTTAALPTADRVRIGWYISNYANGHIKRLDYYAVRKTNAELVVLST